MHLAELSVGGSVVSLWRELDGMTVRTTLADQMIKTTIHIQQTAVGFLSVENIGYFCVSTSGRE